MSKNDFNLASLGKKPIVAYGYFYIWYATRNRLAQSVLGLNSRSTRNKRKIHSNFCGLHRKLQLKYQWTILIYYLYIRDGKFANAKSGWQYCALESATSWHSLILVERGLWDLSEYSFNRSLNRGNPWRSSDDFHSINLILFPFRSLQTINHNLLRKSCRCKLTRFFYGQNQFYQSI